MDRCGRFAADAPAVRQAPSIPAATSGSSAAKRDRFTLTCGQHPAPTKARHVHPSGFPDGVRVEGSHITMPELVGIGFEGKSDLYAEMKALAD